MQELGVDAWITIGTVAGMFSALLLTKLRPDAVFLAAIGVLFATGVLDAKEACSGFSSTSVVVIGVLFVVVAGLTHTGVLQWIVRHLASFGEKSGFEFFVPAAERPRWFDDFLSQLNHDKKEVLSTSRRISSRL